MPYTSSNTTSPHSKNAAFQSQSPYQQRTTQKDNPTQQLIKQAVDYLLQQLKEGKSETLTAYLGRDGPFSCVFLREHFEHCETTPNSYARRRVPCLEGVGPVCKTRRKRNPDSRADGRTPPQEQTTPTGTRRKTRAPSPRLC